MTTPADVPPATVVAGRYELIRPLTRSGAGTVYVARDREEDREVAVEVIPSPVASDESTVSALARDAASAAEAGHPAFIGPLDVGADAGLGALYLVLPLFQGDNLRERMARGPVLAPEALAIIDAILDALAAAHAHGKVHRGLEPEDVVVYVEANGATAVKLLDFGFARHLAAPAASPFISPEQERSSGWVTPAADVYSAGAILFELVARQPPQVPAVPLISVAPFAPPALSALVARCLSNDPVDRPTATALRDELRRLASPPPPQPAAPAPTRTYGPEGAAPASREQAASYAGFAQPIAPPHMTGSPPRKSKPVWPWIVVIGGIVGLCIIVPLVAAIAAFFLAADSASTPPITQPAPYPSNNPFGGTPPIGGGGPALPGPTPAQPPASAVERYNVPVTPLQPARGPADALVTIVEFGDFQCPFCGRASSTISQVLATYPTQVRHVWRDNPLAFHPQAEPAANVAREAFTRAGGDAFWRVHDLVYANQQAIANEDLLRYASQAGIDRSAARRAIDLRSHGGEIREDQALATRIGARGTPTFFINGRPIRGAQPFETFRQIIDEEIAHANQRLQAGVTRSNLYAAIVAEGRTDALPDDPLLGARGPGPAPDGHADDDPNRIYTIAVPSNAPSRGVRDAPIVIQEFSDFQCPFCARVRETIDRVARAYPRRVRVVWRNYPLPFHENAMLAAQAAMEAHAQGGDTKFWRMHDLLFENQRALTRPDLERYGAQIGLDMPRLRRALDERTHEAAVRADMSAADASGARLGTPAFFINGRLLMGAQPYESFVAAIAQAEARGTPE